MTSAAALDLEAEIAEAERRLRALRRLRGSAQAVERLQRIQTEGLPRRHPPLPPMARAELAIYRALRRAYGFGAAVACFKAVKRAAARHPA